VARASGRASSSTRRSRRSSTAANSPTARPAPGLNELYALRDAKVAKDMAKAVDAIHGNEKDREKQQALVEEFKVTFADHLDT
jgi:hypothetical protein